MSDESTHHETIKTDDDVIVDEKNTTRREIDKMTPTTSALNELNINGDKGTSLLQTTKNTINNHESSDLYEYYYRKYSLILNEIDSER